MVGAKLMKLINDIYMCSFFLQIGFHFQRWFGGPVNHDEIK